MATVSSQVLIRMLLLAMAVLILLPVACSAATLSVAGSNSDGVQYTAPESGTYRFTIIGGATSRGIEDPDSSTAYWYNIAHVFKNRPIQWVPYSNEYGTWYGPDAMDYYLGDGIRHTSYSSAEQAGIGLYVDIPLEASQYVILIAPTAQHAYGDASGIITVSVTRALEPSFTATPTSGTAPLSVQFTDTSTGTIESWAWDFTNDGVVDSTLKNPTFTYPKAGSYFAKLAVTGPGSAEPVSVISPDPIVVSPRKAPVAVLSYNPRNPLPKQQVTLDGSSSRSGDGGPLTYSWSVNLVPLEDHSPTIPITIPDANVVLVHLSVVDSSGLSSNIAQEVITPDCSKCKVEAWGHPVYLWEGGPKTGGWHSFVVYTAPDGKRTYYDGQPEIPFPPDFGHLWVRSGFFNEKMSPDGKPYPKPLVNSISESGADAYGKDELLLKYTNLIGNDYFYFPITGPNSNSVTHTILEKSGCSVVLPSNSWYPGWDHPLL